MAESGKVRKYIVPFLFILSGALLYTAKLPIFHSTEIDNKPLVIALNDWSGFYPIVTAEKLGLFKKYGVQVELLKTEDANQSNKAISQGHADLAATASADALILRSQGARVKILMLLDYSKSGDVIIGRKQFNSLSDLKGKTIGVSGLNTFSHLFVSLLLKNHKISETQVEFKSVPPMEVLDALENNLIDAGHSFDPEVSIALSKGYKILGQAGELPGIITDVLIYDQERLTRKQATAITNAIFEAQQLISLKPDLFITSLKGFTPLLPDNILKFINQVHIVDRQGNLAAFKNGRNPKSIYTNLNAISNFYSQRGQVTDNSLYLRLIDRSFVDFSKEPNQ